MKKRGIGLFVTLIIIFLSFSVFSVYGEEFSINEKKYTSVGYIAEEPGSDDDCDYLDIYINKKYTEGTTIKMGDDTCSMDLGEFKRPSSEGCWFLAVEPDGGQDDGAYARIEKGFVLDFRKYQKLQMYTRAWQGGWFEQGCDGGDDAYDCHLLSK